MYATCYRKTLLITLDKTIAKCKNSRTNKSVGMLGAFTVYDLIVLTNLEVITDGKIAIHVILFFCDFKKLFSKQNIWYRTYALTGN